MATKIRRPTGVAVRKISIDPPAPRAGEEFRVTVTVTACVPAPLPLGWEKQRLYVIAMPGYAPELRPTGANYFEFDGQPIIIDTDTDSGYTTFIIREDALDAEGSPIAFPDNLVLTYFVESDRSDADAYRMRIVKIRPPAAAPDPQRIDRKKITA